MVFLHSLHIVITVEETETEKNWLAFFQIVGNARKSEDLNQFPNQKVSTNTA